MKRPTQVSVEVAPDPDQVFQLWKKTLSKQHTAKVTVTEKAPDADQIVQLLEKEPARRPEIVRALIKSIERQVKARNSRRRAVGPSRCSPTFCHVPSAEDPRCPREASAETPPLK